MFIDLKVNGSLICGIIIIDIAKEEVSISNLDKKSLDEIYAIVNRIVHENKKNYLRINNISSLFSYNLL